MKAIQLKYIWYCQNNNLLLPVAVSHHPSPPPPINSPCPVTAWCSRRLSSRKWPAKAIELLHLVVVCQRCGATAWSGISAAPWLSIKFWFGRSVVWSLKSPPVTFTHVGHVATWPSTIYHRPAAQQPSSWLPDGLAACSLFLIKLRH